jgi:hypothetical protein
MSVRHAVGPGVGRSVEETRGSGRPIVSRRASLQNIISSSEWYPIGNPSSRFLVLIEQLALLVCTQEVSKRTNNYTQRPTYLFMVYLATLSVAEIIYRRMIG